MTLNYTYMEAGSIDVDPKSILEEAKKRHEKDDDGGMTLKEYINWHLEELIMAVTPAHEDFDYDIDDSENLLTEIYELL